MANEFYYKADANHLLVHRGTSTQPKQDHFKGDAIDAKVLEMAH
ncbi:hypothetical protein [Corynebacterium hylobatis]|nr:hypothetical protein [Corynebacterium hylobatis]